VDGPPHAHRMNSPAGPQPQALMQAHAAKQEKPRGASPERPGKPQAQRNKRSVPTAHAMVCDALAAATGPGGVRFACKASCLPRRREPRPALQEEEREHGYMASSSLAAIGKPMIIKVQGNMQHTRG